MTEDEAKTKWPVLGRKAGHSKGYVRLRAPSHPNADATGYVYEHVYVASRLLGRGLRHGEVVHHAFGDRADNKRLVICTHQYHQRLHARMAESEAWPEFPARASRRPRCSVCRKKIAYDSVSGLCVDHYFETVRQRPERCSAPECTARAGLRSGLCLRHVRHRANKRRYQPEWNFNG